MVHCMALMMPDLVVTLWPLALVQSRGMACSTICIGNDYTHIPVYMKSLGWNALSKSASCI